MLNKFRLNPSDIFSNDFQKQELRDTVVKGSLAQLIAQGLGFGLSMLNVIVLARLLTPYDFGLVDMVAVVISFLAMFKDAGLSVATIQKDKINSEQISTLFWINSIISLGLTIIVLASSPFVALFYEKSELTAVTAALSVSFVIQGVTIQHSALLRRHLKFVTLAGINIIVQIFGIIVAIVLAYWGFRYWALVLSSLARDLIYLTLIFYSCPWFPRKMEMGSGVRDMLKAGGFITGSNFVGYLSRNSDTILIGKFIGAEAVGLYSRAFTLLTRPLSQIRSPLTSLALPILSSLKNDHERYRSYFRQLLDISITLALPISVYCFLESEFLIRLLLGTKWMAAVPVFRILSVGGVFVAISGAPGLVMMSYGYMKRYMYLTFVVVGVTVLSYIVGIFFGIIGVATGYVFANSIIMIPLIYYGFKGTPITIELVIKAIAGPLFAVLAAGFSAYLFIIYYSENMMIKHIITGSIFFVIYVSVTMLRPKTRETLRSIAGSILSKKG